jgi:putative Holliday junction resolvase
VTSTVREGVRIGVDVGTVRVGVASSDSKAVLATPVATLARRQDGADLDELAALVADRGAVEVVVGLPTSLTGRDGAAAAAARSYAAELARRVTPVPVRLYDERFTTVSAQRSVARVPGRRRRTVIDQAAAVEILQSALDAERGSGRLGLLVEVDT